MEIVDPHPKFTAFKAVMEGQMDFASGEWVRSARDALGDALYEALLIDGNFQKRFAEVEATGDAAAIERATVAGLVIYKRREQLQAFGRQFMQWYEEFRPMRDRPA